MNFWKFMNEVHTAPSYGFHGSGNNISEIILHPLTGNILYSIFLLMLIITTITNIICNIFELSWYTNRKNDILGILYAGIWGMISTLIFLQWILWLIVVVWPFWLFIGLLFLIKYFINKPKKIKPIDKYRQELDKL